MKYTSPLCFLCRCIIAHGLSGGKPPLAPIFNLGPIICTVAHVYPLLRQGAPEWCSQSQLCCIVSAAMKPTPSRWSARKTLQKHARMCAQSRITYLESLLNAHGIDHAPPASGEKSQSGCLDDSGNSQFAHGQTAISFNSKLQNSKLQIGHKKQLQTARLVTSSCKTMFKKTKYRESEILKSES